MLRRAAASHPLLPVHPMAQRLKFLPSELFPPAEKAAGGLSRATSSAHTRGVREHMRRTEAVCFSAATAALKRRCMTGNRAAPPKKGFSLITVEVSAECEEHTRHFLVQKEEKGVCVCACLRGLCLHTGL